jgi:ABC-type transporter Mla maintaining outer membrane lipid asymmetry ATPase subunit MlaF
MEIRGVSLRRGANIILDDVSFTLEPGGVIVFGGRSGHGKSALLEICAGLLKPSGGSVLWDGDDVTCMSKYELYGKRRSVGYVFQVHALISNHSVFDNIALPLRCGTNLTGGQIRERVWSQMEELGISHEIEKKFPEALSTAQLRSVAIARALVNSPALLMLDEPLSGIDPFTANTVIKVLHERWKRDRMSVIMATHSLSAWPEWSAGRFMLRDGHFGPADEAFAPAARELRFNQRYSNAK